jgi:hypothetical protein
MDVRQPHENKVKDCSVVSLSYRKPEIVHKHEKLREKHGALSAHCIQIDLA